jgi:hypothetical protein
MRLIDEILANPRMYDPNLASIKNAIMAEVYIGGKGNKCSTYRDVDVYSVYFKHPHNKKNIKNYYKGIHNSNQYDLQYYTLNSYFRFMLNHKDWIAHFFLWPAEDCILSKTDAYDYLVFNRDKFITKSFLLYQINILAPALVSSNVSEDSPVKNRFMYFVYQRIKCANQYLDQQTYYPHLYSEDYDSIRNGNWIVDDFIKWYYEEQPKLIRRILDSKLTNSLDLDVAKKLLLETNLIYFKDEYNKFTNDQLITLSRII